MNRQFARILWGVFWIGLGLAIAASTLGFWDIGVWSILRDWWPLFIIIPCFISMIGSGMGNGSLIGFFIGILLLLNNLDLIEGSMMRKLILPIILILIGLNIILKSIFNSGRKKRVVQLDENAPEFTAIFATQNYIHPPQPFYGGRAEAVFGTVMLDLRGAVIQKDLVIQASSIFGSVNILTPSNVSVKTTSSSIFGGVENCVRKFEVGAPMIYLDASCMFGGVTIK